VGACAPTVQRQFAAPASFAGPSFDAQAGVFTSFDGAPLGLSVWAPPAGEAPWAVIVGLHGMNDYARTFEFAGPWFAARGVTTYAYDARGHGRSPDRGVWGGEALMSEDLRVAVALARRTYPNARIAVVGESMGAATAINAFGSDRPPAADRLILCAPAVWGWSSLPDFYALTLWTGAHTLPGRHVTPPRNIARRRIPSDNIAMLRAIGRDPNMIFRTRIDALYGLVNLMQEASERVGDVRIPTLFLYGAHDMVVPRAAAVAAAKQLPAGARTALYANGYHMLLRDLQAETVYADILAYLQDQRAPLPSGAPVFVQPRDLLANR